MNPRWISFVSVLLLSCSLSADKYARIECICPVGKEPVHRIFMQAPTGRSGCSGHGGFYTEISWLSVKLPERPSSQARYDASQVVLTGHDSKPIELSGGQVVIDQVKGEVHIAFQTPVGPFWANGAYPLRF